MLLKTDSEKHWAIDGLNSDKKSDKEFDKIIINSITGDIEKYKSLSRKTKPDAIEVTNSNKDFTEKEINFEIPKFSKSLQIFDTKNYFTKSQNWIGHVIEKTDSGFKAKLTDITNPGTFEIGEFENTEISEEDKEYINVGAAFYWSLGFANSNGQRKTESIIRFQRFSQWLQSDFDEVTDRANELFKKINWD